MITQTLFVELGLVVLIALIISLIVKLFRQPIIIGYIIAGIVASPYLLSVIKSEQNLGILAELGIALLLFTVGLSLNPRAIRDFGKVSLITGLGQIIFTFVIGFLILKLFGFSVIMSAYISIAITFSSTIIVMKLLTDKGDIDSLYGRISIGFLIVQDIIAIIILMIISGLQSGVPNTSLLIFGTLLKGLALIAGTALVGIFILPRIARFTARSQELLLLLAVSWCMAVASLFFYFNFSIEIGALIAGVMFSISPYRYEITSRMRPLRDFFLIIFFLLHGSQIIFGSVQANLPSIIILSLFILILKPLIVMSLMGWLGYTKRNSFLVGLTASQISEFSFILVALGVSAKHIPQEALSIITMIGLITIAGSSYGIIYGNRLYNWLSPHLNVFEKKGIKKDESKFHYRKSHDIILFGYNRIGFDLLETFRKINKRFLVVDYNPETILKLVKERVECRYGDAGDTELLNDINFKDAKMIVSTIPDFDTNILLIQHARLINKKIITIVISHQIEEASELYKQGATYVIMPHFLGGHHASQLIQTHGLNLDKFLKEKIAHQKKLKERIKEGHEHPRHESG